MALTEGVVLNDGNNMPLLGFGTWQVNKTILYISWGYDVVNVLFDRPLKM